MVEEEPITPHKAYLTILEHCNSRFIATNQRLVSIGVGFFAVLTLLQGSGYRILTECSCISLTKLLTMNGVYFIVLSLAYLFLTLFTVYEVCRILYWDALLSAALNRIKVHSADDNLGRFYYRLIDETRQDPGRPWRQLYMANWLRTRYLIIALPIILFFLWFVVAFVPV